jgi:exosortase H (IPTLxxWG-CTERM-specific)
MHRLRAAWNWISEPSRRFIPLFLGCLWLLTKLTEAIPRPVIRDFVEATAWVDYRLLDLFFDNVTRNGSTVSYDGFSVRVISECTGLLEAVILVAAILAYKATWRERAIGITLGTILLYSINIVRIDVLLLIGRHTPQFFDFAHIYFWQSLLIVFITAIWLGWVHYFVREEFVREEFVREEFVNEERS